MNESPFLTPRLGPPGPNWETYGKNMRRALVNGKEVPFYSIGALAMAMDKKRSTILMWLRKGFIPEPTFRQPGDGAFYGESGVRLWSADQIHALVRIALEEGVAPGKVRRMSDTSFVGRVRTVWEQNGW